MRTQIRKLRRSAAGYLAAFVIILTAMSLTSHGDVIVQDLFEYPNGNLAGNNGGASLNITNQWNGAWAVGDVGAAADWQVANSHVETAGNVSGVSYSVRPFKESLGLANYYFGFNLMIPDVDEGPFSAGLGIGVTNFFSGQDIELFTEVSAGSYVLRADFWGSGSVAGATLVPGIGYRVTGRIAYGPGASDTLTIWVNPTNAAMSEAFAPYVVRTANFDPGITLGNQNVLLFRNQLNNTLVQLDDFILATTFLDSIPEPSSGMLAALGALVVVWRRRSVNRGA